MQPTEQHADVLVIGAGVAGLIAAAELHRAGRRVLVIDNGTIAEDNLTTNLSRETASKFTALLRSEAALRSEGWNDPAWQRLRLAAGALRRAEDKR